MKLPAIRILAALVAVIVPLSGCSVINYAVNQAEPSTEPQSSAVVSTTPTPEASSTSASAYEYPVSWMFPINQEGWNNNTEINQPGAMQLTNAEGCTFTATQNIYDNGLPAPDDRTATTMELDTWKNEINNRMDGATFDTRDTDEVTAEDGTAVTMVRTDSEYTSKADGVQYKTTIWFRSFTQSTNPGFVTLNYGCPSPTYKDEDIAALVGNTHLTYIEDGQHGIA